MQMYETPNEPTGLVYDAQGNKWRKDENYRFECSYPGNTGLRVWPTIGYAEFQVGQTVDIDQVHLVKKGVK